MPNVQSGHYSFYLSVSSPPVTSRHVVTWHSTILSPPVTSRHGTTYHRLGSSHVTAWYRVSSPPVTSRHFTSRHGITSHRLQSRHFKHVNTPVPHGGLTDQRRLRRKLRMEPIIPPVKTVVPQSWLSDRKLEKGAPCGTLCWQGSKGLGV